ncbi:MAG TPA: diacylglycerol kinase [Erythrobacter sp.]|nr:diacylglycerol kinase [Erythrobacter sp.]
MKNSTILHRAGFSLRGLGIAWRNERSLRTHVLVSLALEALLIWRGVEPLWLAIVTLAIAVGWALELANAAIEALCDRLHPARDPMIGAVKDLASASAFIVNMTMGVLGVAAFVSTG